MFKCVHTNVFESFESFEIRNSKSLNCPPVRTQSKFQIEIWQSDLVENTTSSEVPPSHMRGEPPAPAPRGQKSSLPVRLRKRDLVCGAIVRGNARSIEPKEVFKFRSKLKFSNFKFSISNKFEVWVWVWKFQTSSFKLHEVRTSSLFGEFSNKLVCLGNFQTNLKFEFGLEIFKLQV